MRPLAVFLTVLLAACAWNAAAAPTVVRVGPDRIVLDAPPGFSDSLSLASPRLQELAEAQTSPSNRVLLFAITDADLRLFMNGDRPDFRRYLVVATPVRLEHERLSAGQFAALAAEALKEMGPAPQDVEFRAHLDVQARGQLHTLAELRREPLMAGVLQGSRLPPPKGNPELDKQPRYVLTSTMLMLVHGKPLTLSVMTQYDGAADVEWIRGITLSWADLVQRLNRPR